MKKLISLLLSATVITGMTATAFPTMQADAATATKPLLLSTILANWNTRIANEQKRFPKDSYWNHIDQSKQDENTYSWSPCNHDAHGKNECTYASVCPYPVSDKHVTISYSPDPDALSATTLPQCYGFARKLARDIWGTNKFVHYKIEKGGIINYTVGGNKLYEPQVGDQVRLSFIVKDYDERTKTQKEREQGHSIFITAIDGNRIVFADCNGNLNDCQINWDKSYYYDDLNTKHTVQVTKDYLRKFAVAVERPIIQGDFNLNGKIDRDDIDCFKNTYLVDGNLKSGIDAPEYDVNGDLIVDTNDQTKLSYFANLSKADGYIFGTGDSDVKMAYNAVPSGCFLYSGGIYRPITSTTCAFIGTFEAAKTSFVVPSYVKSYTVTEIGEDFRQGPGKSKLANLKSITIPATVTTIRSFAFTYQGDSAALTTVTFSGTPSLTTIASEAFLCCDKMTNLDLSKCSKLKTIGSRAFLRCDALSTVSFPQTTYGTGGISTAYNAFPTSDCFQYQGGIYRTLSTSTVALIGTFEVNADTLTVPSTVKKDGKSYTVTMIGDEFRQGPGKSMLSNVKTLTIPATVTTIRNFAFTYCQDPAALTTVNFSGTPSLTTIANEAFYACNNMTSLNLSNCNKLTSIGNGAFYGCNKLSSITFPYATSGSTQSTPTLGGANGLFKNTAKSNVSTLYFYNTRSGQRTVTLQDSDVTLWRNKKIAIAVTGNVRIKDTKGNTLATYNNSQLYQLSPNK